MPWVSRHRVSRRGLSRSEIVVVVGMGLVAAAVVLPYLAQSQRSARRVACSARLADLARTTLFMVELDPDHAFPGYVNEQAVDAAGQRQKTSWAFPLLPYLDRPLDPATGKPPGPEILGPWNKIYAQVGPMGDDDLRGKVPSEYISQLVCPDDPRGKKQGRQAWLTYVANCGLPDAEATDEFPADWPANGVFLERFLDRDPSRIVTLPFLEANDGAEYTLLFAENLDAGKWTDTSEAAVGFLWYPGTPQATHDPAGKVLAINQQRGKGDGSVRYARPSSLHAGGVNVAYADGHTDFLVGEIDYRIYAAYMSPDGQNTKWPGSDEPLDPPWREVRR